MFGSSLFCHVKEALLSLVRPLNFVHHDKHHASCRCERSGKMGTTELTHDDVAVVMRALGIAGWSGNGKCQDCCLLEEAHVFLEDKTASFRELEEAFCLFDCDGDGFITSIELQNVIGRLGLEDSMYEDCDEMIQVFDKDGDGRISLDEFKAMMQGAV